MTWLVLKSGPSYQKGPESTSTFPSLFTSAAHAPSAQKCGVTSIFVHSPVGPGGGVDWASERAGEMTVQARTAVRSFMKREAAGFRRRAQKRQANPPPFLLLTQTPAKPAPGDPARAGGSDPGLSRDRSENAGAPPASRCLLLPARYRPCRVASPPIRRPDRQFLS